jgi:hypothetical protein
VTAHLIGAQQAICLLEDTVRTTTSVVSSHLSALSIRYFALQSYLFNTFPAHNAVHVALNNATHQFTAYRLLAGCLDTGFISSLRSLLLLAYP